MAEIDEIFSKYVKPEPDAIDGVLGAAFIVMDKHGKTLYSNAAGKLTFDSASSTFSIDAVCWIASLTKLVTAVAAMQLVEKGLIKPDDDVGKILPQLSNMEIVVGFGDDGVPLTTKQSKLITLRGLGYDVFDPTLVKWSAATGRTVNTNSYTLEGYTLPLVFEPGDGWVYGVGPDWVGHLVAVLTHSTFEAYLEENVFGPLGMSSTTFRMAKRPDLVERRAAMALRAQPRGPLSAGGSDYVPEHPSMASGGSGLFSTPSDYSKLLGALVQGGKNVLRPESVRGLCKPELSDNTFLMANFESPFHDAFCCEYPPGTQANYGLGGAINMNDIPGKRRKGSIMWSGMSNPHWWLDMESGITGTLFTQVFPPGDAVVGQFYDELERAVYRTLDP